MQRTQVELQQKINQMATDRDEPAPILMEGAPAIHRRPIMSKEKWKVSDVHDQVEIKIGNTTIVIHYEDALSIGLAIQHHGKQAKATAGDLSRHMRVLGTLKDIAGQ